MSTPSKSVNHSFLPLCAQVKPRQLRLATLFPGLLPSCCLAQMSFLLALCGLQPFSNHAHMSQSQSPRPPSRCMCAVLIALLETRLYRQSAVDLDLPMLPLHLPSPGSSPITIQ